MGSNIIMAIGALLILGLFLNSSDRLMSGNTQVAEQNEYYITALSLAQSIIDEAKTKAYDQNTATHGVTDSTGFSAALGPDAGETVPATDTLTTASPFSAAAPGFLSTTKFNDVDDYNGYKRLVNTPRAEGYKLSVTVNWADPTNPGTLRVTKQYCKVMKVVAKSPFMPDSLVLNYAFIY